MRLRAFGSALAAGLVFGVLALQPLAQLTVVALFIDNSDASARPMVEGLPTPAGLYWSPRTLNMVLQIGRMPSAGVLGFEVISFLVLAYLLLRVLNPTFRVTTGVDWDPRILTRTYMHTAPLIKAFLIAVTAFLPLVGLWWLAAAIVRHSGVACVVQGAVTGAAVWLLFTRQGVAGDYESGNYLWPSERRVALSLAGRGALAGAIVGLCARLAPFNPPDRLFAFYSMLSGIGESRWWSLACTVVGLAALLGIACTGVCVALAADDGGPRRRALGALGWAMACAFILWVGRVLIPSQMRDRYDFAMATEPGVALAKQAGVATSPSGADTVLLLGGGRAETYLVDRQSIAGLDISPKALGRIDAFLRRRDYRTTLAAPAFATLLDGAALALDDAEELRLASLRLEKCPDTLFTQLLIGKLATCAASPVAQKYAAMLADEGRFRCADSAARLLIGDLLARLGMRQEAEREYRLAGIADTRIEDRLSARAVLTDGVVSGRVLLNGQPAVGVRVGLVRTAATSDPAGMLSARGRLRPFWLRSVSPAGVTDGQGRFRLEHVVAGSYRTVVCFPGIVRGTLRGAGRDPGAVYSGYAARSVDLGTLDMRTGG